MDKSWDVWQKKEVVDEIKPALGNPEGVWGGNRPDWFPSYKTVLDVGCGPGIFMKMLTLNGEKYTGIDSSQYMIDYAVEEYPGADFRVADALQMPFKDASFDFVFNNAVLIHMPIEVGIKAMEEMARVTKKFLCFNCYSHTEDIQLNLGDIGILQAYGKDTLALQIDRLVVNYDFTVELVESTPVSMGSKDVPEFVCDTERWFFTKKRKATSTKSAGL